MSETSGYVTVKKLVERGILARPIDGNHGEIHPKGDDFVATGVPFITAADIKDGRVDVRGCAFISEKQARSLRKGFAKLGDVLLTHKATMGRTAIVDEIPEGLDWIVLTPQVTYYRVLRKDVLEPRYLKFYFDSSAFQTLLEAWSGGGSTRAYLGITKQLDLPIPVLPIDKQRAIASTLGPLDDKIAQNRRTGGALEGLARATFKAWFVDFEPVKAKATGAASFPGMSFAVFDALTDRFVDSELGPVPEGWDTPPFDELMSESKERVGNEDVPAYSSTNEGVFPRNDRFKKDLSKSQSKNLLVRRGDLVFGLSREILNFGVMYDKVGCVSPVYKVFRPKGTLLSSRFIESMIRQRDGYYRQVVKSSSREGQSVTADHFLRLAMLVPSKPVRQEFRTFEDSMRNLIDHLDRESSKLAALRDYLLPRLLSGLVTVRDSQSQAEDKA